MADELIKEGEKYFIKTEVDLQERINYQTSIVSSLQAQLDEAISSLNQMTSKKNDAVVNPIV